MIWDKPKMEVEKYMQAMEGFIKSALFYSVNEKEVINILKSLKNTTTTDNYGFSNQLMKTLLPLIVLPITVLIN